MTILKPQDAFCPLPGANSEGYGFLQVNFEPIWHPGVDYNVNHGGAQDDLNLPVVVPWDGVVVAAIPKVFYSWGRIVVVRHVLPYDVVSAGLLVKAGTIVYSRYGHLNSFSAWKGQAVKAGQEIGRCGGSNGTMDGPAQNKLLDPKDKNGQWWSHLHFDIRIGFLGRGLPQWDAGNEHAVQEWPGVRSYGYPAKEDSKSLLRATALRFLDPHAAIPAGRMRNAYKTPRVL
ncbi:M23 family metallopeptidase [Deinococcus kurensis]|uniref:M23 family metallopeptidase n=1 Tax=Deinococcus kurensis TaxID=2662757 RepID=UPI0012D3420A|nr:M23 family metallopeptidase [Deinococcus kurensis]